MFNILKFVALFFSIGLVAVFAVSDDKVIPRSAPIVKCFPVIIEPRVETLDALIWIENSSEARVAFFGKEGTFTVYCDFVHLEAKMEDGKWNTIVDFSRKKFSHEILTKEINEPQIHVFDSTMRKSGYPERQNGLVNLRINLGETRIK